MHHQSRAQQVVCRATRGTRAMHNSQDACLTWCRIMNQRNPYQRRLLTWRRHRTRLCRWVESNSWHLCVQWRCHRRFKRKDENQLWCPQWHQFPNLLALVALSLEVWCAAFCGTLLNGNARACGDLEQFKKEWPLLDQIFTPTTHRPVPLSRLSPGSCRCPHSKKIVTRLSFLVARGQTLDVKSPQITTKRLIKTQLCILWPHLSLIEWVTRPARATWLFLRNFLGLEIRGTLYICTFPSTVHMSGNLCMHSSECPACARTLVSKSKEFLSVSWHRAVVCPPQTENPKEVEWCTGTFDRPPETTLLPASSI